MGMGMKPVMMMDGDGDENGDGDEDGDRMEGG